MKYSSSKDILTFISFSSHVWSKWLKQHANLHVLRRWDIYKVNQKRHSSLLYIFLKIKQKLTRYIPCWWKFKVMKISHACMQSPQHGLWNMDMHQLLLMPFFWSHALNTLRACFKFFIQIRVDNHCIYDARFGIHSNPSFICHGLTPWHHWSYTFCDALPRANLECCC